MRKSLLKFQATVCAAFLVTSAFSADWSGFYLGANVGAQFGRSTDTTGNLGYNSDNQKWDYGESGFTAGTHFGYNFRANDYLLLGPELNLGYLQLSGSGVQPGSPGGDTAGQTSGDFYTTLRARVGIAQGDWLLYAAGGAIGVNYNKGIVDECAVAPCGGSTVTAYGKSFDWGYTIGAGAERVVGKRWSVRLEYLYFNLGSQNFTGSTNVGTAYDWNATTAGHIVRAGLTFHFGGFESAPPAPQPTTEKVSENKGNGQSAEPAKVAEVKEPETELVATLPVDVLFSLGEWKLNAKSEAVLEKIAADLLKNPSQEILVYGYADSSGKRSLNKLLSERRAKSVKAYLVKAGLKEERITAQGFGIERAIASNDTYEGRAKNRRVEIYVQSRHGSTK